MAILRHFGYAFAVVFASVCGTFMAASAWQSAQFPGAATRGEVQLIWMLMLPGIIVASVVAMLLIEVERGREWPDDGETRCRVCGYILRGLTEPRCSECGERL